MQPQTKRSEIKTCTQNHTHGVMDTLTDDTEVVPPPA